MGWLDWDLQRHGWRVEAFNLAVCCLRCGGTNYLGSTCCVSGLKCDYKETTPPFGMAGSETRLGLGEKRLSKNVSKSGTPKISFGPMNQSLWINPYGGFGVKSEDAHSGVRLKKQVSSHKQFLKTFFSFYGAQPTRLGLS